MIWLTLDRQKEIDKKILELQTLYATSDLLQLIKGSQLDILQYDFNNSDILGAIVYKGYRISNRDKPFDKDTILINEVKSSNNQHFTLAHEFGHYVLGHRREGIAFRIDFSSSHYSNNEKIKIEELEANYFAGAILMPEDLILKVRDIASISTEEIASIFGVSKNAVDVRIKWIEKNSE